MEQAHARHQGHVLAVLVVADALQNELVRNHGRNVLAEMALDDVQHQIQGRHAAGAGVAVAVNSEELAGKNDFGEFFLQRSHVLPMHHGLVLVQQTGLGQGVAPGTQGPQRHIALTDFS